MAPSNPNKLTTNGSSERPPKRTGSASTSPSNSRFVKTLEDTEDKITGADASKYIQTASKLYSENKNEFSRTASRLASSTDVKAMEQKVKDFAASSQVLMNVLDDVRRIHPFIDVAVLAFKAVVTLELKRRDNDQKVIVLQVKMQDMMEVFVQLRVIKPKQKEPSQRLTVEERLTRLCESIADDIRSCGNLCDAYSKKRLLVKLLKSPIYEARLADFADTFSERQRELELALQVFTAHGVSIANDALVDIQSALRSTQESIKLLFEKLQTPLEKELKKLIDSKGGPDKCIQDDGTLKELIVLRSSGGQDASQEISEHQSTQGIYSQPNTFIPSSYVPYGSGLTSDLYSGPSSYGQFYPPIPPRVVPPRNYSDENLRRMGPVQVPYPMQSQQAPQYEYSSLHRRTSSTQMHSRRSRHGFHTRQSSYMQTPMHTVYPRTSSPTRVSRQSHATPRTPIVDPISLPRLNEDDSSSNVSDVTSPTTADHPPPFVVNDLKDELREDIDTDLKKNMQIFLRKLNVQQNQLKEIEKSVVRQGDRVISAVREGPHDRVTDLELRAIWKEMGWKLGVPVNEFVLTLHDYFVAKYSDNIVLDDYFNHTPSPGSTAQEQTAALRKAITAAKNRAAEKWALKHVSMVNIIPLKEAFDGDASGYVSVWEANQVASLRPRDWSFLQWLAYWAAGRHFTIWQYRQKIGSILKQMYKLLDQLLPTNRSLVDRYLDSMFTIEQILSSTIPCIDKLEDGLKEKVIIYQHAEEEAMERKLDALNYEIDGPDTLGLIIGRSEIERNLYPLLYLLLKHHLATIHAGCKVVLDRDEMLTAEQTLEHIYDGIESRVSTLEIISANNPYNPPMTYFMTFAFGMYASYYNHQSPYISRLIDLPGSIETESEDPEASKGVALKYPSPHTINLKHDNVDILDIESCVSGVAGFWTGHLYDSEQHSAHGMIQFRIDTWNFTNGRIRGRGSYSKGTLFIDGKIHVEQQHRGLEATLVGEPDYEKDGKLHLFIRGRLHVLREISRGTSISRLPTQYTISGEWSQRRGTPTLGSLYLSQTPAWVHRFKPLTYDGVNRSRSLWHFAFKAILHQVRSRHGFFDDDFVKSKLTELRRGAELARYQYLLDLLNPLDQQEWNAFLLTSTPWDVRIYRSIARSHFFWASIHYKITCSTCSRIILGPRFHDLSDISGHPPDLCESCFRQRDDSTRHQLLPHPFATAKLSHFLHERESGKILSLAYRLQTTPRFSPESGYFLPPSRFPDGSDGSSSGPPIPPLPLPPPGAVSSPLVPAPHPKSRPGWTSPAKRVRFTPSTGKSSHHGGSTTSTSFPPLFERPSPIVSGIPFAPATAGSAFYANPNSYPGAMSGSAVEPSSTVQQCISCDCDVNLITASYWVCIKCFELENGYTSNSIELDKFKVVICLECELNDRPPLRDGVGHIVTHPLVRMPEHIPPEMWMQVQGQRHRRTSSKRRMVVEFLKGVFGSKERDESPMQEVVGPWPMGTPKEPDEEHEENEED